MKPVINIMDKNEKQDRKVLNNPINIEPIIKELTDNHMELLKLDTDKAHELMEKQIEKIIRSKGMDKSSKEILEKIKSHIFGYGILEKYIKDPEVNNVYINRHDDIWIQKGLYRMKVDECFESPEDVRTYVLIMASNLSGEINRDKPIVTLNDEKRNLRIICAIEPAVQNCPTVVIRKHQDINEKLSLDKLIENEMISQGAADFLIDMIDRGKNIIFCGIGGSGKTTLLRALMNRTSDKKRAMVIEESSELQIMKRNTLAYKIKRNERGNTIGLGDYIEYGLKSSVELFIFGETRGEEAMALYDAAFSGHQVLTTLHTNDSKEVPERLLINMKKSGTDISSDILLSMVTKSIDYIVQMKDLKVESISQVTERGIEKMERRNYEDISNASDTDITDMDHSS